MVPWTHAAHAAHCTEASFYICDRPVTGMNVVACSLVENVSQPGATSENVSTVSCVSNVLVVHRFHVLLVVLDAVHSVM